MLLNLVECEHLPIFEQLQLEEAILRTDHRNWCLLNHGSPPALVMGISGKKELLIDQERHLHHPIPLIRRFSGGGTVVIDQNTLFATFICNAEDTAIPCFPNEVLCWTKKIYQDVFEGHNFQLQENDYSIGNRKFGGNAQYMCKGRWLHHTSLLWDYDPALMNLLLHPPKTPAYRQHRKHEDFLCCLKDHLPARSAFNERLVATLAKSWKVKQFSLVEARKMMDQTHRKSTHLIA